MPILSVDSHSFLAYDTMGSIAKKNGDDSVSIPVANFVHLITCALRLDGVYACVLSRLDNIHWQHAKDIAKAVETSLHVAACRLRPSEAANRWEAFLTCAPCWQDSKCIKKIQEERKSEDVRVEFGTFKRLVSFAICGHSATISETGMNWTCAISTEKWMDVGMVDAALRLVIHHTDTSRRKLNFLGALFPVE